MDSFDSDFKISNLTTQRWKHSIRLGKWLECLESVRLLLDSVGYTSSVKATTGRELTVKRVIRLATKYMELGIYTYRISTTWYPKSNPTQNGPF